jgi:hypothetical protein
MDPEVDPVAQRTGDASGVPINHGRPAVAAPLFLAGMAARARVHT